MGWTKLGHVWNSSGAHAWARHSLMTPVPVELVPGKIRVYGGVRDESGISRIAWIDVDATAPTRVIAVADRPALGIGAPGMFDDNGVILGDVLHVGHEVLRMYYVGFQLVQNAKFLAFTGLAESRDGGDTFERVQPTPVLDREPQAGFINALHSILPLKNGGYRAWISCGQRWELIDGAPYPQYNCWVIDSADGVCFNMANAKKCLDVSGREYRVGRPRANRVAGGYELRVTSDTIDKQYACHLATSTDGIEFNRTDVVELPRGSAGDWDSEMTCYPARIETSLGETYLFYNGNGMGRTGVGVARWDAPST